MRLRNHANPPLLLTPPLCTPPDPRVDQALQVLADLRERADEALPVEPAEVDELLAGGYVSALALERARRRLRAQALALSNDAAAGQPEPPVELTRVAQRELRLAAWEREMRELLQVLRRGRPAPTKPAPTPAPQATKPRRSA